MWEPGGADSSGPSEEKASRLTQRWTEVRGLTWGNSVGQWAFWPFPSRGGAARRRVRSVPPPHRPPEWRASWLEGRPGRNGRGRGEEWGSRTRLHPNWPDEKQSGSTTRTETSRKKIKPPRRETVWSRGGRTKTTGEEEELWNRLLSSLIFFYFFSQ